MSSAGATQLYFVKEVTEGTTPASPLQAARVTSLSDFNAVLEHQESEELRADRNPGDQILTNFQSQGSFPFELSYGTFDELIAGVMQNDWSTAVNLANQSIDTNAGLSLYTDAALANAFANVSVGQFVKFTGFTNAENNGYKRVTAKADSNNITVANLDLVTEAGQTDIGVKAEVCKNGATKRSYTLARNFSDITVGNEWHVIRGAVMNTMELTLQARGIASGTMSFNGRTFAAETANPGSGVTAATTSQVLNTVSHFKEFYKDDVILTGIRPLSFTFNVNNNVNDEPELGILGAGDVTLGGVSAGGAVGFYFNADTLFDDALADTRVGFALRLEDGAGNSLIFDLPRLVLTAPTVEVPNRNESNRSSYEMRAYVHPTYNFTAAVHRFPA